MQSIESKVKSRIYGHGRGWCFTQKDFADLGVAEAIKSSIFRLEKAGLIRRIARGIYDYPREHEKLGVLWPSIEEVANAVARKYQLKIQPTGAYAANLLGLSEQVPGKVVYLVDGSSREVQVGNTLIQFKKTTVKNMKTAGKVSGLVIQALRYMGKDFITERMISTLKRRLNDDDKKRLSLDAHLAPAWISKIIRKQIIEE